MAQIFPFLLLLLLWPFKSQLSRLLFYCFIFRLAMHRYVPVPSSYFWLNSNCTAIKSQPKITSTSMYVIKTHAMYEYVWTQQTFRITIAYAFNLFPVVNIRHYVILYHQNSSLFSPGMYKCFIRIMFMLLLWMSAAVCWHGFYIRSIWAPSVHLMFANLNPVLCWMVRCRCSFIFALVLCRKCSETKIRI